MSELTVAEVVRQAMETGKTQNITTNEINDVVKIYKNVSVEEQYKKTSKENLLNVVNHIADQVIKRRENPKMSNQKIQTYYSENKHMNYFDVFLEDGERGKIEKALKENGLGNDVLIGLKPNQKYDSTFNGIHIVQTTNKDIDPADPDSIYVVSLKISYKGKTIYEFDRENAEINISPKQFSVLEGLGIEVKPATSNQKEGSIDKIKALLTNADGEEYKMYVRKSKTGKTSKVYRDAYGRFASYSDIIGE